MKILFWLPPWNSQGNPIFYKNSFRKHLALQANLLQEAGCRVDFVLPEWFLNQRSILDSDINVLALPKTASFDLTGQVSDPSTILYKDPNGPMTHKVAENLRQYLRRDYDVILLWETPVPFLEMLYPDALIVHQMPGAFSRAPYPHLVTFDPAGLYRHGSLFKNASDILDGTLPEHTNCMVQEFRKEIIKNSIIFYVFDKDLLKIGKYKEIALLPLQVTAHYNFLADTNYQSQMDFLVDVLRSSDPDTGIIVTQYVTQNVSDMVLTPEVHAHIKSVWPNIIHLESFNQIPSISSYLLQYINTVITCSSSLGFQALAWHRRLVVWQETFLKPFATPEIKSLSEEWSDTCERVLGFILSRNQVLSSRITGDRAFLCSLLEDMLARKRAGRSGLDLCPDFREVDRSYPESLLSSFRPDAGVKEFAGSNIPVSEEQKLVNNFKKILSSAEIKIISFDVFDTLIDRPVENPADAFKLVEFSVQKQNPGFYDFARIRETAEVEARAETHKGEITIDDIYEKVKEIYGVDQSRIEWARNAEIHHEYQLCRARKIGKKLWDVAKISGKKIYLISDMYLPKEIVEKILHKEGYTGYQELFLSSVHGVRKKEGALYDLVLSGVGAEGKNWLHVGDNKIADIEKAEERGIRTFHLCRAIDRMRGNKHYRALFSSSFKRRERARCLVAGLIARRLFDIPSGAFEKDTHFQGNPLHLGYAGLGPMLMGYVLWLARQAERDRVSRLYFLSREGWVLHRMYRLMQEAGHFTVPSSYLYASRRAVRVASLAEVEDVTMLAAHPFDHNVELGTLLKDRFGFPPSGVDDASLENAGFTSLAQTLSANSNDKIKFLKFCGLLSKKIIHNSENERSVYIAYLKNMGLYSEENPAVVDIGWQCNMQGSLSRLLGRTLTGYYYMTFQGAEHWENFGNKINAYASESCSRDIDNWIIKNNHVVEYLICHTDPTLIRMDYKDGIFFPVFHAEEGLALRRQLIEQVHEGALQFAKDLIGVVGEGCRTLRIDPSLGERILSSFLANPAPADARLLIGHKFENVLSGVKAKLIIETKSTKPATSSIWPVGHQAIFSTLDIRSSKKLESAKADTVINPGSKRVVQQKLVTATAKMEQFLLHAFCNEKKISKYEKNREAFFLDSKIRLLRLWFRFTKWMAGNNQGFVGRRK